MEDRFMRLVVNALSIIILKSMGYNINSMYHTWKIYKDDFLTQLNDEEK